MLKHVILQYSLGCSFIAGDGAKGWHHTRQTLKKVMPTSAVDSHFEVFAKTVTFLTGAKILAF
jgi:hypothetical protein